MNEHTHPTGEPTGEPVGEPAEKPSELHLPEPTPPVYAPPPAAPAAAAPVPDPLPPVTPPPLVSQYQAPQQAPQGHPAQPAAQPGWQPAPEQLAQPQYSQPPQQAAQQYPQQYPQPPQYPQPQQYQQLPPEQYAQQPGAAPRKGLSVGAWIGIGAGALVLVLALVIGGGFALLSALRTSGPTPAAPPTVEEEPQLEQRDLVTMDDATSFSAGPYWGVPMETGWDIVRFDVEGINEFRNPTAGCQFLTYQGYGPAGLQSDRDRGATEETLPTALQIGIPWTAATADPTVSEDGIAQLEVNWNYQLEMQRYLASYPTAEGDRERQMVLRTFMPNNLVLYAEVDCPATPAGKDAAKQVLDGLSVTEY